MSAALSEAHTGLVPSVALADTSVPVPMCGNEQGKNAVMISGAPRDGMRTWGQARRCRLRDTGSSPACAPLLRNSRKDSV